MYEILMGGYGSAGILWFSGTELPFVDNFFNVVSGIVKDERG